MKNAFLFHLKSSFHSRDIQIFVFLTSPHCSLSVIAFEDDRKFINCLNKNLLSRFILYIEKERYDIETSSIGKVINKEHLYEKTMQKICTKS